MNLDQEEFSKMIKDFGRFVMQVLSGTNEDQKGSLKVNLQAFQNLCESFESLTTNGSKKNASQIEHSDNLNSDKFIEKENKSSDKVACPSKKTVKVPSNSENANSEPEIKVNKRPLEVMHEPEIEEQEVIEIASLHEKETIAIVEISQNSTTLENPDFESQFFNKGMPEKNVGKRPLKSKNEEEYKKKRVKSDPHREIELPDEIWTKILSYVKSVDLFQNVSLVCKRFYNIHRDAVVYLEVKNTVLKKDFQKAIKVLKQCKSVKMFKIEWTERKHCSAKSMMSYMNDIIKQVLVSSPNLKTLKVFLFNNKFGKSSSLDTKTISTFGNRLEYLEIDNNNKKSFIANLQELKTLKVKGLNGSMDIISLSKNCPKLESILFDFKGMWHYENEYLQNFNADAFDKYFFKKAATLKEVSFEYASNDKLLRSINQCQNIVKFKAFWCKITEFGLKRISELPNLKELALHDIKPFNLMEQIQTGIVGNTWSNSEALLSLLPNLNKKKLKCLVLSECLGMYNDIFEELSEQHFPELETLFFGNRQFGFFFENPEMIMSNLIKNCPKLKNIHFKGVFDDNDKLYEYATSKHSNISFKIHKPDCITFTEEYNYWF